MKRVILVCDVCGKETNEWVDGRARRVVFGEYEAESRDVCPKCAIRVIERLLGMLRRHDTYFSLTPCLEQMAFDIAEAQKHNTAAQKGKQETVDA